MTRAPLLAVIPGSAPDLKGLALKAEGVGADLLLLGYGGFGVDDEPLIQASALIGATRRIGLCAAATTALGEPFTLARGFAALDHLSGGRAAWQVMLAPPSAMTPFAHRPSLSAGDAGLRGREFVDVAFALWDSWSPDALVDDRAVGRFSDPEKVRAIGHEGAWFQVRGPLNTPRPPQGRPVIIHEAQADPEWSATTADIVIMRADDLRQAHDSSKAYRAAADRRGRSLKLLLETPLASAAGCVSWLAATGFDGLAVLMGEGGQNALAPLAAAMGKPVDGEGSLRERLEQAP